MLKFIHLLNLINIFEFMKKTKALVLFSGGLDSSLAMEILKRQGIEVIALIFKSYFFDGQRAIQVCQKNEINFKIIEFTEEHLAMVKKPKYGYGKAANPCIDCHALMLKKAKKIMYQERYDFVATGEVLGQRPMSQNFKALNIVTQESGLEGYLVRPLSAKKLPVTQAEEKGLVIRDKLLDIQGRSRKRQLALAKSYQLSGFGSPAGGCLLTEKIFGQRLKELFNYQPDCDGNDVELLKYGRHFWQERVKLVVGRDAQENKRLEKLWRPGDILITMSNYNGPTTLVRNYGQDKISSQVITQTKQLTQRYSTKARHQKDVEFELKIDKN